MKKLCVLLAAVLLLSGAIAQAGVDFDAGMYEGSRGVLPYRFAQFTAAGKSSALLVYLHGRSASGTDNEQQLLKDSLLNAVPFITAHGADCFVLAPQCSAEYQWAAVVPDVQQLIADFARGHGIADGRIYLVGESMGGGGVWQLVAQYPTLAKKAVIIAAVPRTVDAEQFTHTELFVVVGSKDKIGDPRKAEPVSRKIRQAGGSATVKILAGKTHEQTCAEGLSADVLAWLFDE